MVLNYKQMAHTMKEFERGRPFALEDGSLFNHVHFGFRNGRYPLYVHVTE